MQVGSETPGGLDQEPGKRVVHFGGLDGREPEADGGDGGDQGFEEVSQGRPTPGRGPGVGPPGPVLPVRADMYPRQHDFGMMVRQDLRLRDQIRNRSRTIRSPPDRRRAEGAVLFSPVLDLEQTPGPYPPTWSGA